MIRTAPQHAPHTRPTVREKTGNSGCYKQILPHSLDQFVGRAKVLVRTSPRPKMLQSTTKQTHGLCLVDKMSIITLTYVVQIFPALKNTHHHASHNPQTNKQDQKGSKRYLADFSKLRTKVHGASRCGFSRIYIPPKTSKNLVVIILILALRGHIHWGREPAMPSANFGLPSQHAGQD